MNPPVRILVFVSWILGSVLPAGAVLQVPAPVVSLPGLGPAVPGEGPALSGPLLSPGQGINDPQDAGTIRTVAGGSVGDGEPAVDAGLVLPNEMAVDRDGNLYISDGSNNRVRRVDALTGRISTVAGSGGRGFSGDGGQAVNADLFLCWGIALDRFGNLYIADRNNHRIRRVDALTGTITTAVGTSPSGFSGDGGPAEEAQLRVPQDIAIDRAGNLFIADRSNHRIRMVDASTGQIRTVAGNGTAGSGGDGGSALAAQLGRPESIALDSAGNLYVTTDHRIRRIDAGTGVITTVSGSSFGFSGDGGPATDAQFNDPQGLAVDAQGNLTVADRDNHRIRKIDIQSGLVTTLAGTEQGFFGDGGPATMARFTAPEGLVLDGVGGLWISDRVNHRIRKVDLQTGIVATVAGGRVGDGQPAVDARLALPRKTALDGAGNLYIVDRSYDRIRRVDAETGLISTVAGTGIRGFSGDGGPATSARLALPFGIALDPLTESLLIADEFNFRIRKVDLKTGLMTTVAGTGTPGFFGDGGPATLAQLDNPEGVAVDGSGNLFIADSDNHRIRRVDAATGIITTVAGTEESGASGDNGPATGAALNFPRDVALDGEGNLFIADRRNHRIRKVDLGTGVITTAAGTGVPGFFGDDGPAILAELNDPSSIGADGAGNLYVADRDNLRIRKIDAGTGIITTVAGREILGFSGDGGPAAQATLSAPEGVSVALSGDLLISDTGNHRIRRVGGIGAPVTPGGEEPPAAGGQAPPATGGLPEAVDHRVPQDFPTIQAAIDAAEPGQVVGVAAGTYVENIRLKEGVSVVGAGAEGTIIDGGGSNTVWGADNALIRGFTIANGGSDGVFAWSTAPTIQDCIITGCEAGISTASNSIIQGNIITGNTEYGIFASSPGVPTMTSNLIVGNRDGVVFAWSDGLVVNNTIDANSRDGIRTRLPDAPLRTDLRNNIVTNNGGNGIEAYAFDGVAQTIGYNNVWNNGSDYRDVDPGAGALSDDPLFVNPTAPPATKRAGGEDRAGEDARLRERQLASERRAMAGPPDVSRGRRPSAKAVSAVEFDYHLQTGSPAIDTGDPSEAYRDVDGSRNDMGAYGGPTPFTLGEPVEPKAGDDPAEPVAGDVPAGAVGPIALDLDLAAGDQGKRQTTASLKGGDFVTIDLVATEGAQGRIGFQAVLTFDSSRLQFSSFSPSDVFSGALPINTPGEGQIEISVALLGSRTTQDAGSMGQVTFQVLDGFEGETVVTIRSGQFDTDAQTIGSGGATVTIGGAPSAPSPDFDGDGTVGFSDFLQFAGGFGARQGAANYDARFDLDSSGDVGFTDFLLFAQAFGQPASP